MSHISLHAAALTLTLPTYLPIQTSSPSQPNSIINQSQYPSRKRKQKQQTQKSHFPTRFDVKNIQVYPPRVVVTSRIQRNVIQPAAARMYKQINHGLFESYN